jgi:hypothetical protein
MRLRGKLIGTLTTADIRALLENGVAESQIVEYKRELPAGADADKREFLADVSAFANTAGGCLLYGVETRRDANQQDTGIPSALPGLPGANLDKEKLRLEAMLQDGLSPPLRGLIRFQEVASPSVDATLLVMGIPSSFAGPHRVTYQKVNKFWRRSESGKYEPDVTELKRMFLESSTWSDEADRFRAERSDKVRKGLINVNVTSSTFIHVLPLGRLGAYIDLKPHELKLRSLLSPPTEQGWSNRFGVEGFMTYTAGTGGLVDSYTQWFRFGGIEGYSADYLRVWKGDDGQTRPIFDAKGLTIMLERYVPEAITAVREIFEHQPPYAIGVSVHSVRGSYIVNERNQLGEPIDQNDIVPPLVVVDETDPASVRVALRPIVDTIWQSGGFAEEPTTGPR